MASCVPPQVLGPSVDDRAVLAVARLAVGHGAACLDLDVRRVRAAHEREIRNLVEPAAQRQVDRVLAERIERGCGRSQRPQELQRNGALHFASLRWAALAARAACAFLRTLGSSRCRCGASPLAMRSAMVALAAFERLFEPSDSRWRAMASATCGGMARRIEPSLPTVSRKMVSPRSRWR